jgi:cyclopropane fatty-acyl-phospholipid synthase-like methyltransferase
MKIYNWDLEGFEKAYSKYYYMPHLSSCEDGVDEHGHFHDTQHECGRASCICAFEDENITYSKLFFEKDYIFKNRAQHLIEGLSIPAGSKIFVGGCGFGYLMEALADKRMNVWGCDNSPYIQLNIDTEASYPIHNIDLLDSNFIELIRQDTGVYYFDYVITEDVLTSYSEESYPNFFNNLEGILHPNKSKKNIIHIIDTNCGSMFIQKSLEEWDLVNQNHTWLNHEAKR